MKIVADKDIFRVEDFFGSHGELVLLPGREISRENLLDADALLVRTVTRITPELLLDTPIRFVGSATSGIDHISPDITQGSGVHVFNAAGCNAQAVVNYVFSSLATASTSRKSDWRKWGVGVIGAGNVGGRLGKTLESIGMDFKVYDPFLDNSHPLAPQFASLEEVVAQDVVTIHTPLTHHDAFPTWHLLDEHLLALLKPDAVLINAARGEVIDNRLLETYLSDHPDIDAFLDVWENEPAISTTLLDRVVVGTPHIAGYSQRGKLNGTLWVHEAFCSYFGLVHAPGVTMPVPEEINTLIGASEIEILNHCILSAYTPGRDALNYDVERNVSRFDWLRNHYAFRREFGDFVVRQEGLPDNVVEVLKTLEFQVI